MAEDVGSLVVRIEANLKNFETGMNNVTNKVDGFGSKVKKLGGIIAGAFAVKAVGDFFASTIKDAAEAEDNLKQLETVIESTGGKAGVTADQVTNMAAELQKVTKFSDDAIIAGDNLLLTFTSIGKDVFPQATETMLNMSQALGQDIKGSAIQLGKALNDPINGVTALKRVGVSFTESQMEQIKAMQESGNIMGAQKLILAELNTEFGNAARAAGETFSGKLERVKNQFGEIKESIGNALLPILSNLAGWFIDKMPQIQGFVTVAVDDIKTAFNGLRTILQPIIDNVMPMLFSKFNEASSTVLPLIMDALKNLTETVLPPLQRIFEVFINDVLPKLSDAFMYWITNIYPIIVDAFNYIVDNVLPPLIEIIEYIATEIIPLLAAKFQEWIPIIVDIITGLWDVIKLVLDLIVKAFKNSWSNIKGFVSVAVQVITDIVGGLLKILQGIIDFVAGVFTGDWERAWNGIKDIFVGIWDVIKGVVKGAINAIITAINNFLRGFNKITGSIGDTIGINLKIPDIPKLATGTNFVPFDTAAFIHKGEAVIPADNNPNNPSASNPIGGGTFNFEGMFKGAVFNVRSDNDAKLIAREMYNLTTSRNRGSGVVPAT